jgi:alkanesulfonate monooxygenase SsuD/methylene tetrahydromethanopterin reductase-like flavin-dependent oxidoreductase (luciferase family)
MCQVKVRFAVSLAPAAADPEALEAFACGAELRGFDTIWFSDLPVLAATDPLLGVAFASAVTRRVKLGVNLVPFGYRPFVLARRLAEVDRLSGGRLLVTLVPGLDSRGERWALGTSGRHRGQLLEDHLVELRRWWSGGPAPEEEAEGLVLPVVPLHQPLEVWLGGSGPDALQRAGRLADGWLGSLLSPEQAGAMRVRIQEAAAAVGREIDPEHFGLSIAYAHEREDLAHAARLRRLATARRLTGVTDELVPVGAAALRELVGRLVEQGLSKFVVRPLAPLRSISDELDWLAAALLDLQS